MTTPTTAASASPTSSTPGGAMPSCPHLAAMAAATSGGCTPVMDRLKAETRAAHEATEAIPFSAAMVARQLPIERFAGKLAAYLPIHAALEAALAASAAPVLRAVWSPDLAKTALLERDLHDFSAAGIAPDPAGLVPAARFAARIAELAATRPAALLGILYVLEGSTLGAAMLRGHLEGAYGAQLQGGLAYYSPYGPSPMPHWKQFRETMNAAVGAADQDDVIAGANEAFAAIGEVLAALSRDLR